MKKNAIKGTIVIEQGVNVWPHELHTATALANAGYDVRFIPENKTMGSADAFIDNTIFEFKAPEGSSTKSIQRNIVRAITHQSANIVIDSFRMKRIHDSSIQSFLIARLREGKGIKRLLFVTRGGKVVDINEIVR